MMAYQLPKFALSIRQPWAWAVINADKDIENRDWWTRYRGPVCIHAAKGCTKDEYEEAAFFIEHTFGVTIPHLKELDRGGIVGIANMTDCVRHSPSRWFFGTYGFVLEDVQPLEFIPRRGRLGFFDWRKQP